MNQPIATVPSMVATAPITEPAIYNPENHRQREITEVKAMQRDALAKAMDATLHDRERRAWMRTYNELSERRRILSNRPLPGSLRPDAQRKARKERSVLTYPAPSIAAQAYMMGDAADTNAASNAASNVSTSTTSAPAAAPCPHGKAWNEHCTECDGQQPTAT